MGSATGFLMGPTQQPPSEATIKKKEMITNLFKLIFLLIMHDLLDLILYVPSTIC